MIFVDDELVLALKAEEDEVVGLTLQNRYVLWTRDTYNVWESPDYNKYVWESAVSWIKRAFKSRKAIESYSDGDLRGVREHHGEDLS